MENSNGLSTVRNMSQTSKDILPPSEPFVCVPPSHVPFFSIQSGCKSKPMEGCIHHQRCSSESFLTEEPPSWLEDLLDDSEPVGPKHHRRSASDTSTYLDKTIDCVLAGSLGNLQTNGNPVDAKHAPFSRNPWSFDGVPNKTPDSSLKSVDCTDGFSARGKGTAHQTSGPSYAPGEGRIEKPNRQGSSSQNQQSPGEKGDIMQSKTGAPKADAKRAKNNRQSAHRSRVRKLQYIAELERNVQVLQVEGAGFVAEIKFRDQHNLIVSMENRTLRQRVETLSQELLIKHMEHEMLEREIGRLQALLQLQMHREQHRPEATALLKAAV